MSEENKAIVRRLYEIVSTGDFGRAGEIVDEGAPDNELLPDDPPARLIDTFKEAFAEAREGFPDLSVTVEDVMSEGDRVAARVTMRGTHTGEFQGIAPTGKRVQVGAIDMFRISEGKVVEHWGHSDNPTGFLRQSECS
ncbi:ester cyclase [soil metagenome]